MNQENHQTNKLFKKQRDYKRQGNYTKERHQWQKDYTVDSLYEAIYEAIKSKKEL
jgi:hypothetical protein